MTDLFDLPFEDEPTSRQPEPRRRSPLATPTPERRTPPTAAPPRRRVLTVTELTVRVRDLLESEFFEVWVEGELSNCRVWNTGHLYFTLKDGASQIRGVMFRSALRYLKFKPADGLRVVARGRVSVYEPKGEYQLVCEHLEPHGLGALQLAFDQLKKRLQAEGLFDAGAQAAAAGAAAQDRHRHLARRRGDPRHHQGAAPALRERAPRDPPGARAGRGRGARDRARARGRSARVPGVDVVIVGRGGGSIEDLWAFNEEVVARAIARVAGAGHLGGRPRDRRDHRRLRRRPARADAVGGRRARRRREGRVLRAHRSPATIGCAPRRAARVQRLSRRVHVARAAGRRSPASRPRRDARPPRRGADARARARRCAPASPARERRRAAAASASSTTFDLGPPARRHPHAAGRGATAGSTARCARRQHRADAQLGNVRRPARDAQPARGPRPRLRRLLERRPDARPARRGGGRARRHGARDAGRGRAGLRGPMPPIRHEDHGLTCGTSVDIRAR